MPAGMRARRVRFAAGTDKPDMAEVMPFDIRVHDMRTKRSHVAHIDFEPTSRTVSMKRKRLLPLIEDALAQPLGAAYVGIPMGDVTAGGGPMEFEDLTAPRSSGYVNLRRAASRNIYVFHRDDALIQRLGGMPAAAAAAAAAGLRRASPDVPVFYAVPWRHFM